MSGPDLDPALRLGLPEMDATHEEFAALLHAARTCAAADFPARLGALVAHTRGHFAREQALMEGSRFPALAEHRADHDRVLGALEQFLARLAQGRARLARAYLDEQLPGWLEVHVRTMDSALAAHLRATGLPTR